MIFSDCLIVNVTLTICRVITILKLYNLGTLYPRNNTDLQIIIYHSIHFNTGLNRWSMIYIPFIYYFYCKKTLTTKFSGLFCLHCHCMLTSSFILCWLNSEYVSASCFRQALSCGLLLKNCRCSCWNLSILKHQQY